MTAYCPEEPEPEEPEEPPVPEEPELPPMLDDPEVPEEPDDAAGADDDLRAFLCFLAFFFFGVAWLAPVSLLVPALDEAPGSLPVVALGLLELPPEVAPVPDAPEPMEPEVPDDGVVADEPLEPEVPDAPEVPEEPDEPDMPEEPEEPDMPEVPLLPDAPVSLFWLLGLDALLPVLDPVPDEACASTTEDTDATKTNERDRIVFNVMSGSLS